MSKKITALIPGAALALGIACIAKWLETLESSARASNSPLRRS